MNPKISIVGAGKIGGALAVALSRKNFEIVNIVSRTLASAQNLAEKLKTPARCFDAAQISEIEFSDLVLIATPDFEIAATANALAANPTLQDATVLHTSGALSSEILRDLKKRRTQTGSLHPLVSVSDAQIGAEKFGGAYFCVEGDAQAVEIAQTLVRALGGTSFAIAPEYKPLYHAAAVMSAGHVVALFDLAAETLADCGVERATANRILLPLLNSTINNLNNQPPARALTGTFARADIETLKKHLASLNGKAAEKIYRELGKRSLKLAAEAGADAGKLEQMFLMVNGEW